MNLEKYAVQNRTAIYESSLGLFEIRNTTSESFKRKQNRGYHKDFPTVSDRTVRDLKKRIRKLEPQQKEFSNLKKQKSTL